MHPVVGKGLAVRALALRDLIFMVREDQILSACMDIDGLAKVFLGHLGALDMPAWTALAPRRLPERLSFFFRFPENEIGRFFLAFLAGYLDLTEAGLQIVQIFMGQFSVLFKGFGAEINRAVSCHIRMSFFDQRIDHLDHTADLLSRLRILRRRFDVHHLHIFFALCDIALGDRLRIHALLDGFPDDLVIHISKVRYIVYFVSFVLKIPADRIKYDHRSCISNMNKIVNGRSAHIHLNLARFDRHKLLFSAGQCVENFHNLITPLLF